MATDFEAFVRERSAALLRYGYVLSGNPHDAADLTQEALARLGQSWHRVHNRDDPEGYVRTTMARLHISWWRRRRRERLVDAVPDRQYTENAFDRADTGDLWTAIVALPPRQRVVLLLRYYDQRGDEEIAALLGISRGTVRSQAARGLDKLRAAVGDRLDQLSGRC